MCRASANNNAMACSAVVMELPNGVFITITPFAVAAAKVDIVDAEARAADDLETLARSSTLAVTLVARTNCQPVEASNHLGETLSVLADLRLKIDFNAARLENGDGGGRKRIRNQDARSQAATPGAFRQANLI